MSTKSNQTIHHVELDDEFKTCPVCGYTDGFHSAFKKLDETTLWLFVCPSCHSTFDIGLTV
jgi:transposase